MFTITFLNFHTKTSQIFPHASKWELNSSTCSEEKSCSPLWIFYSLHLSQKIPLFLPSKCSYNSTTHDPTTTTLGKLLPALRLLHIFSPLTSCFCLPLLSYTHCGLYPTPVVISELKLKYSISCSKASNIFPSNYRSKADPYSDPQAMCDQPRFLPGSSAASPFSTALQPLFLKPAMLSSLGAFASAVPAAREFFPYIAT